MEKSVIFLMPLLLISGCGVSSRNTDRPVESRREIIGDQVPVVPVQSLEVATQPAVAEQASTTDKATLLEQAQGGNPKAQYLLAMLYLDDPTTEHPLREAAHWLSQSAKEGYADAQYELGLMYVDGSGKPQNYDKAAHLLQEAKNQGHVKASYYFGSAVLSKYVATALDATYRGIPDERQLYLPFSDNYFFRFS